VYVLFKQRFPNELERLTDIPASLYDFEEMIGITLAPVKSKKIN